MTERIQYGDLQVAKVLDSLLVDEILPGLNVTHEEFWATFNKIVEDFSQKNRSLLTFRENLQKKIDNWHLSKKGLIHDHQEYKSFLREIGYWVDETHDFQIKLQE